MKGWMLHRVRADSTDDVLAAVATNAELIRPVSSGHVFHCYTTRILRIDAHTRDTEVVHLENYEGKAAFWDAYQNEQDMLDVVWEARWHKLFALPYLREVGGALPALLDEYKAQYMHVDSRDEERVLLGECRDDCRIVFEAIRETTTPSARYATAEEEWNDITNVWRWTKRNTSVSSYPFLRPGLDIYKADGFDLGGEGETLFYAIAKVHF